MDNFVAKSMTKDLQKLGIISFALDKQRSYRNNCCINVLYEYHEEVYCVVVDVDKNYKKLESKYLLKVLKERLEIKRSQIKHKLKVKEEYRYVDVEESRYIAFFIRDRVKELRDMLNKPMNMTYQEKYSNNKVDEMLKNGISPLEILNRAKSDWGVRFKKDQKEIKNLELLLVKEAQNG